MSNTDRSSGPAAVPVWRGLVTHPRHGPLPALLLALTVVTGVVDAVSVLSLGRVFVANMTGNVVFVGFALAGAPGFALGASLSALAGFLVGAALGGAVADRPGARRGALLRGSAAVELVLVAAALLVAHLAGPHIGAGARESMAALIAIAMGMQNAVVRRLAVPDLTTTVLTMTLTGIAADLRNHAGRRAVVVRLLAVLSMLAGAICGAFLVLDVSVPAALTLAVGLLALVTAGAAIAAGRSGPWQSQPSA